MGKRTPLYERHLESDGHMVPFSGWDMPLHYGSQLEEHHAVRRRAGMFDVSHMAVVDIAGPGALAYLQELLANDVAKLQIGQAMYSCMLNARGGVVDDLIVYRRARGAESEFRVVVNAGTRDKDLQWMGEVARNHDMRLRPRDDLVMVAVQGPQARELAAPALPAELAASALQLRPFHAAERGEFFVGRTGYTGEDGWEIILPAARGPQLWDVLHAEGIQPCGLGARDTLRLEAGMNLYGQDMDDETSPLISGLGWTVAWEPASRTFIGRPPLELERQAGPAAKLAGLVLGGRGVMRRGQKVMTDAGEGEITSGGFSPTMGCSIALARLPMKASGACEVAIRDTRRPAQIVRPPFVRNGRVLIARAPDQKS